MKFNLKKFAPVLTGLVMLGGSVGFAAAAALESYPAPFVTNGAADVAIILGSDSKPIDNVGAVQIAAQLQQHMGGTTTTTTSTASGGDSIKLERSSDKFNLGDNATEVFLTAIDKSHLSNLLASGTYKDHNNDEFDYTQKIDLGANIELQHFADNDYKSKEPSIGFKITSGTPILNYTFDFTKDPDYDHSDIEATKIKIMGKEYYVLDLGETGSSEYMTLLDSAETKTIAEGETINMTVAGKSYTVYLEYVGSTPEVKLNINGESTNSLQELQTYKLDDGSFVGIRDIMYNSKDTGVSKVEFSLGSGKLKMTNDQLMGGSVELNDETISDLKAYIYNSTKFNKFVIQWIADDKLFVAPGTELVMPGFENIKFVMSAMNYPSEETTEIKYDGDQSLQLKIPIKDGTASFNVLYGNNTAFTGIGKDANTLLVTTNNTWINLSDVPNDEWFVASWNSSTEAESYLLSATVFTKDSANRTTIKNDITQKNLCEDLVAGDSCTIGNVVLHVHSVSKVGSTKWVVFNISSGGTFNKIYSASGMQLMLPWAPVHQNSSSVDFAVSGAGVVNLSAATFFNQSHATGPTTSWTFWGYEEDKDQKLAQKAFNTTIDWTAGTAPNTKITVSAARVDSAFDGTSGFEIGTTDVYELIGQSDLATKILYDTSGTQDWAKIVYHGGQSYADVYVTAPSVTVTPGAGSVTTGGTLGTVAYLDSDIASVSDKNLIVVGGSAVNKVAAKLLGVDYPTYGGQEGWSKATGVGVNQAIVELLDSPYTTGKVAMLVAGWEGSDTLRATTVLTKGTPAITGQKVLLDTSTETPTVITQ